MIGTYTSTFKVLDELGVEFSPAPTTPYSFTVELADVYGCDLGTGVTSIDLTYPVYTTQNVDARYVGAADTLYSDLDAEIDLGGFDTNQCKFSFSLQNLDGSAWSNDLLTIQ